MRTPESNSGRDRPEGFAPRDAGAAARVEPGSASDRPTIVRGSSSPSRQPAGSSRGGGGATPLPQPGQVIDTFVLEEAIGAGGMGAVFRAHDAKLDREVALKLLPPDQTDDPEVVQRFYQEGRSAAQLDHENIARVYSLGQDGAYHYIVFEYIEGVTIRRKVDQSGPCTLSEAVDVTLQIAAALVHAANRGVVHRDIKPSNIILTPQGRAKLVDMGLARRFERQTDVGLTQTGMTLGTFDYISPEQARDPRDVDVRSDLYSLGCTLFHMLSGQPPFPGGTVLQKLLQHQEEAPPDIRALNPAVPADLARVLTKLMAKDRERRYQTPEQLVRDLLAVAGQQGLALSLSRVEAPVWTPSPNRPPWERHLVYLAPAAGFLLLAAGLLWWGREWADPTSSTSTPLGEFGSTAPPRPSPPLSVAGGGRSPTVEAVAARSVNVRPTDDLVGAIAAAPRRSVVTLVDDGPYLLGSRIGASRGDAPLLDRDVRIQAAPGKRPILRFAADSRRADAPAPALLAFSGGRIELDGLILEFEEAPPVGRKAALLVEDAELKLKGCSFRREEGSETGSAGLPAVLGRVVRGGPDGGRPPFLFADQCHFDPGAGAVAVRCEGPADLRFRDCTFGPGGTSIQLDDRGGGVSPDCDVLIERSSFMAGPAPVVRINGAAAVFQVDDCVIAPGAAGDAPGGLAQVDHPRNLVWNGRSNLYGKLDAYLTVVGPDGAETTVTDFEHWREGASEIREVRSEQTRARVWESSDPAQDLALEPDDPTRAFQLAAGASPSTRRGATRGPFGAILAEPAGPRLAAALPNSDGTDSPRDTPSPPPPLTTDPPAAAPETPRPAETAGPSAPSDDEPPPMPMPMPMPTAVTSRPNEAVDVPAMPPMTAPTDRREPAEAVGPPVATARTEPTPASSPARGAAPQGRNIEADEDVIRSAEQFTNTLARLGAKGGLLRIESGADLELSTVEFQGAAAWRIEAEPGARRPRIRFRPPLFDARTASAWTTLLSLGEGKLELLGLDLVVHGSNPQSMSRIAAVGLAGGAELVMTDCTATLSGEASSHAVVAVTPASTPIDARRPESDRPAVVRIRDGFLRSIGDGFSTASNQQLDVELDNVLVATDGSLLHAMGRPRAVRRTPSLALKLGRVSAIVKEGLVHLESSPDEPELPVVEVQAQGSVLSTGFDAGPLLRVDGRDSMDELRDRIRWSGENVGYHQIVAYRRDEVAQTGVRPRIYVRADWNNFVAKDESPVLEVQFLNKPRTSESAEALTRDDFRLSPQSPLYRTSADLKRIPDAPTPEP